MRIRKAAAKKWMNDSVWRFSIYIKLMIILSMEKERNINET
jgi:hypothetical protein